MSIEAVTQFLQRLAEDNVLQRRLDTFVAAAGLNKPVAAADLVEFAVQHGFAFTVKELRRATSHSDSKDHPLEESAESE